MTAPIAGLAPLLMVFDMPTSLRFYRDLLGFKVVEASGPGDQVGWVLLALDGTELMLNTAYEDQYRPTARDPGRVAAHADTVLYFGCRDLDALHQQLRARGVEAQPPTLTGHGFRAVSCSDPEGYGLCFHWPVTEAAEAVWRRRDWRQAQLPGAERRVR